MSIADVSIAECDLWSESPSERLRAARACNTEYRDEVIQYLIGNSPMNPWPFGMPTVVNPYLVILGPSPGGSPNPTDVHVSESKPYQAPTFGEAHPGFHYEDSRNYWRKIRELSVGFLRGFEEKLSDADCYALSGQMNFGVGGFGTATKDAIEPAYAKWVPEIIVEKLKPKIVIMFGLLSLLKKETKIALDVASSGHFDIDWKVPEKKVPFKYYKSKQLSFCSWCIERPDGNSTTVVSWPNHPSRSPMTNINTWRASIREAVALFTV